MTTEIQTFSSYLSKNKDMVKMQIAAALPKHMNADRMLRILITEVKKTPDLNKCTFQSIMSSIIQASQLGLEVSSILGHGYLIPFNSKDKKTGKYIKECQFIIGYRGMIDLARRSGKLISITAQVVYENDHFDFKYGLDEKLDHIPYHGGDRGKFICAYAIVKLDQGSYQFDVMWNSEIEDIKKQSKSAGSSFSPWQTHTDEMRKKTVIRRLFKYLPISIELYENLVKDDIKDVVDVSADLLKITSDDSNASDNDENDLPTQLQPPSQSDIIASKINQSSYEEIKSGEINTKK